jgi:serine/threonine-protein kinase
MLTPAGAKLLDFGIAAFAGAPDVDEGGEVLGTPAYLAPERLLGGDVSPATDVYALGVLTYRLLGHELPWSAETPAEIIRAHIMLEPAPLPPIDGLPTAVNDICDRCLARDPDLRPSASEVATVLAAASEGAAPTWDIATWRALALASEPTRGVTLRRRPFPAAMAIGTGLLVLMAIALFLAGPWGRDELAAGAPGATPPRIPAVPAEETALAQPAPGTPVIVTTEVVPVPGTPGAVTTRVVTRPATVAASVGLIPIAPTTLPVATTAQTSPPPPAGETISALGGSVRVLCQGFLATVLSVEPAPGFTIKDDDRGPANQVQVVLISANHESEIKARCGPLGLVPTVKESPQ